MLLPSQLEGIGRFTYETVRRMATAHPEHRFTLFFDRSFSGEYIFPENVARVVLFPPARHPLLFIWWFEWSVVRALKKYKADVFLSTDGFASLSAKVRTVLVIHDLAWLHYPQFIGWQPRAYYRFFTPHFLKKADKVIAVSDFTLRDILARYPLKNPDIAVVYNGVREGFRPLDAVAQASVRAKYTDGAAYFLYVGSIHPRKNIARLIEAFGLYREKMNDQELNGPVKLVLAGRMGWQTEEIRDAADRSAYRLDVIFTGYMAENELPALTASAFASAYVSQFEGFGVPILEAMQCDVPAIVSNMSSMPEVAGEAALLVNPNSATDIAEAMFLLATQPEVYRRLVKLGKVQREKFNWASSSEQLWTAVEETANN